MVSDYLHSISRMVRTRATTAPTPTSARQEASEPATDTRVVTPPPTEEVVREGEKGENEQVQNKGLPPQPTPEMINQVLAYLSGLSDQGQAPPVFSAPTPPVSEVKHAATMAPRMDASLDIDVSTSHYKAYNDK